MWNVDVLEIFFFLLSGSRNAAAILIIVVEIASNTYFTMHYSIMK
jgi:hypothetical protein